MPQIVYKSNKEIPNKWPQMFVTGKSVSAEQAKEIIRRTDYFLNELEPFANDKSFVNRWLEKSGKKEIVDLFDDNYKAKYNFEDAFREKWGFIKTRYLQNDWAYSCFIAGPHGWCSPTGDISFRHNVGKWPSVEEIANDWAVLLDNFPFLELNATLYDGECCEENVNPIVTISVGNGAVVVHDNHEVHHVERKPEKFSISGMFGDAHGLPNDWMEEFATKSKETIKELKRGL